MLFNFEGPEAFFPLRAGRGPGGTSQGEARGCSSDGRAPALHAGGREFEPLHLHQERESDAERWAHSSDG